jgi:hypothetical protein
MPGYHPLRDHIMDFLITRSARSRARPRRGTTRATRRWCARPTRPRKDTRMTRAELTEKILDIKRERAWTWKHICAEIGGMSDTMIVGALLGQMKLVKPLAAKAAALFGSAKSSSAC